ncbi:glucoamylase [Kaistia soli DSM 19436]|uniref:Glucoamylase n=1 Tax=Kaistia soli DSM 19436 TaxID=1122133 RepID=A0A1M5J0W6_9HYPH|nr:glucan 1,4-alpha-glucosidase [Kaistia soli]SHG34258.1 glucoamylase [Kaistia soli DSM 19436]
MDASDTVPPGKPGLPPRWTSSAKSGVGTAGTAASRIWFTVSHGILNEIYWPRVDAACTRDFGFMVTGLDGYFAEEKRDADHGIAMIEEGVPAFRLTNTARDGRWRIEKEVLTDPKRETLLQRLTFEALQGSESDYRLFGLIAPHLINGGSNNTAWIDDYKGTPMLFATGAKAGALAVACSVPFLARSVGYVGASDGWQQLSRDGELNESWRMAADGNVALAAEIDLAAANEALIAVAFGSRWEEAAYKALSSIQAGFDVARRAYSAGWRAYQKRLLPLDRPAGASNLNSYRISAAVLATHQPASFPGAAIASLSIPWGFSKGDEDLGGYHLVWPRDLVETAGGFLAAGAVDEAKAVLAYLTAIQEADGHWSQNVWLDGSPYWGGVQMDECAFPIILADMLRRHGHLDSIEIARIKPMIEKAAHFIVCNGPVTGQDRWEEDAGYSPFTLSVEIAGLLAAADLLEILGEKKAAHYLRQTADSWNEDIEYWTYATGTELSKQLGIEGYYVRIATADTADGASPLDGFVPIKNRPPADMSKHATMLISPDALALVRFGLRAADDPRIVDTVTAIDATLKAELPQGPIWYRYNGDGYGEHEDGRPFNGTGIGRPWPLLTGERAHYEIAAGRIPLAEQLLDTLEQSASSGGMLPEQVWDSADIPQRELYHGHPSGSAMPLVWAHSEHIKLLRSLSDGAVFDMPPQTVKRYQQDKVKAEVRIWRFTQKIRTVSHGRALRIEVESPAVVHWSKDNWATTEDTPTTLNAFGIHMLDIDTSRIAAGHIIRFTFFWPDSNRWENVDFEVTVERARHDAHRGSR